MTWYLQKSSQNPTTIYCIAFKLTSGYEYDISHLNNELKIIKKDIFIKDFILYQPEDVDIISREQYSKNFNIAPKDRLNSVHSEEE